MRAETNRVRIETFRGLRDRLRRVGALDDFRLDFKAVCRIRRDERAQLHSKFRIIFARPAVCFSPQRAGGSMTWTSFNVPPRCRIAQP